MFSIRYELSKPPPESDFVFLRDLGKADDMRLRYNLFLGNFSLETDEGKIGAVEQPLLDFAIALNWIVDILAEKTEGEEAFDFTESTDVITFKRSGDRVMISTDFDEEEDVVLETSFRELEDTARAFYTDVFQQVMDDNEDLKDNPDFMKHFKRTLKPS
jgi:hypothetical protein